LSIDSADVLACIFSKRIF